MRLGSVVCYPVGNGEMGFGRLDAHDRMVGLPSLDQAIEMMRLIILHGRLEGYGGSDEWLILQKVPGNYYGVRKVSRVDGSSVLLHGVGIVQCGVAGGNGVAVPSGSAGSVANWLAVKYFLAHEPSFGDRGRVRWDSERDDELQRQLAALGAASVGWLQTWLPSERRRFAEQRVDALRRCGSMRLFTVQDRYGRTLAGVDDEMPVFLTPVACILRTGPDLMSEVQARQRLDALNRRWDVLGPFLTRDAGPWLREVAEACDVLP